jgi:uncharacterized protein (TIGR02246 family)
MKADAATEAAVRAVLDRVNDAYATRNLDGLLATIAPDPDVVMYGTGADEKRLGHQGVRAQAERDWSQTEASTIRYESISVSAAGSVAWVAADAAFEVKAGGQAMTLPARITFVLEKRDNAWLIVQAHFSLPAADQAEGEAFPN